MRLHTVIDASRQELSPQGMDFPVTPLQWVPSEPGHARVQPELFLKREDLLPFGGGNKVRRFQCWLNELAEREGPPGTRRRKRIAVLSDQGAHTFKVLTAMLQQGVAPIASLLFWERKTPKTPYSETIRCTYLRNPDVSVQSGKSLRLFLRFLWMKCRLPRDTVVMGIGGSVRTQSQPYRIAFEECLRQLADLGKAESRVWHLFPVVSGNMADSFLRTIRELKLKNHAVIGVLTAQLVSLRLFARLKYVWKRNILLVRQPHISFEESQRVAARFFKRTGVRVDPNHTLYAVRLLDELPACVQADDDIIFWITCPLVRESELSFAVCEKAPKESRRFSTEKES